MNLLRERTDKTYLSSNLCPQGLSSEFQALQLAHESQSGDVARKVGGKLFKDEVSIKGHKMTVIDVIAMLFILKHHKATHVVR